MHTTIGGLFDTVVLLAPDELLMVIKELQAYYERHAQWQEPVRG
jgi:hypothetical protein